MKRFFISIVLLINVLSISSCSSKIESGKVSVDENGSASVEVQIKDKNEAK